MRPFALALLALAFSWALPAVAAEQGLGFTAGMTGGIGTHYRRIWDSGWGAGGSAALWNSGPNLAYSAGFQVLRSLLESRHGRLYAIAGLGVTQAYLQPGMPTIFAAGSGLGIQIGQGPGPTFALEGQMSLLGNGSLGWVLAPLPAASLIYYY